jgi:probable rRNA maturation factor
VNPLIDVAIEAEDWASLENSRGLAEIVLITAIGESGISLAPGAEISVLLCSDTFIRKLNREWREVDEPTNVLSFPTGGNAAPAGLLGDIVIAFETAAREAAEKAVPLRDHVAHLLVHGFLHLIGHDHVLPAEAEVMERLERAVLAKLGISDPYQPSLMEESAGINE